ncbi:transcription elongation factor GreA [Zymobacter palmae]|uniref:transcription elongation factor GreA n=1 Tax=Zymobacter palmae TaxID=33074 RepID=UPI000E74A0A6|nr:transcription elongation factor GreA [Zymobacter palmae]
MPSIAAVVSARLATKAELSTALGVHDLYELLEILQVDSHNAYIANDYARSRS